MILVLIWSEKLSKRLFEKRMGCLPVKPVSVDPAELNIPEKATKNRSTRKLNSILPASFSIETNGSQYSSLINGDYIKNGFLVYQSVGGVTKVFLSNKKIWVLLYRNGFKYFCKSISKILI